MCANPPPLTPPPAVNQANYYKITKYEELKYNYVTDPKICPGNQY